MASISRQHGHGHNQRGAAASICKQRHTQQLEDIIVEEMYEYEHEYGEVGIRIKIASVVVE